MCDPDDPAGPAFTPSAPSAVFVTTGGKDECSENENECGKAGLQRA